MSHESPVLALRGLTKSYGTAPRGFRLGPLDLDLEPGRVLAFVGPNGAGKTTTLHSIMNLVRRDGGEVEICGRPNRPGDPGWKQQIGFVGEVQGYYRQWTVARNLAFLSRFYDHWDEARAEALARRFGLDLEVPFQALSRGNRAKLPLVAALAHQPRLLLLDEPTQGLDPVVRAEVLDALWEFLEDGERAILYSTHVLSDVSRLADELAFLRDGRLVERTAKDQLTESWRRISFRYERQDAHLDGLDAARGLRRLGADHQVMSSDHQATARHLRQIGASGVQMSRLTIDEIAVEILREGHRVASA